MIICFVVVSDSRENAISKEIHRGVHESKSACHKRQALAFG